MPRNARFWLYWNGGYVKLTLRPDQELTIHTGCTTDEGWASETHTYRHEGDRVECEIVDDGQDCDGRLTRYWHGYAMLDELRDHEGYETPDVLLPAWQEASSSQRDQYAEMAGY